MKKLIGFAILIAILVFALVLAGTVTAFLDLPSLVVIAGITAALTLISFRKDMTKKDVLIRIRKYSKYGGWFTFLMGLIQYFSVLNVPFDFKVFSVCLLGLFYGYLASFITDCFIE